MKKIFTLFALVICSAAFGQLVNGGMETWRTYTAGSSSTLTAPTGWNASDTIVFTYGPLICPTCTFLPQTFKCDTAYSGSYAAKLMTRNMGGTVITEDEMTNCKITFNTTTMREVRSGGTPVTARVDSVTIWLKFVPHGGDSGVVNVQAVLAGAGAGGVDSVIGDANDVTITGGGSNYITSTPNWTKHTYVFTYFTGTVVPDHIQIDFHTSYTTLQHDSTTMYVDDVVLYPPGPTGVQLLGSSGVSCYPNPAGNTLHIQTANHQNTTAELYNMLGQRIATQPLHDYITEMNTSNLSTGIYYLHLLDANNEVVYSTKIEKQ